MLGLAGAPVALLLAGCAGSKVVLTPDTISANGPTVPQYVSRPEVRMDEPLPTPVTESFAVDSPTHVAEVDPNAPVVERTGEDPGIVPPGTPPAPVGVGLHVPRNGQAPLLRGLASDTLLPADWEGFSTLVSKRRPVAIDFSPRAAEAELVAANPDDVIVAKTGDRNWQYNNLLPGQTVAAGALDINAPMWGSGVQLGGLQISSWPTGADVVMPEGSFGFSSAIGGLASSNSTATRGSYATSAGSGSLRYGLTPDLTVESQMQSATAMNLVGVGGMYSMGRWGTLSAGQAQSRYNVEQGHRVSLGYRYDAQDFSLSLRNDYSSAGFTDLAAYHDGTTENQRLSNSLRADVPVSGWGVFSGTFVGTRDGSSTTNRLGVLHQMSVARDISLGMGADRDIEDGSVSMHMNVSMPVEVFVGGLRLPFGF